MRTSSVRLIAVVSLVLGLVACGGGSGTGPSGGAKVDQTITGTVDVFGTNIHTFTTTRSGRMTITLSWVNSTIDLDLYLTADTCNVYPLFGACDVLAQSISGSGTSESVIRTVQNNQRFNIFVDNFSEVLGTNYEIRIEIE